ncbi:MAG: FAD-dependent monooxygenase [Burkholderiales bacterium]
MIETEVLVVGSGPTGASAALFLARHGVAVTLISRSRWVSDTPRAHITNARTMEILRNVGLAEACYAKASANSYQANKVWVTTLAGEELGRLMSWGNHPTRRAEYELASPGKMCDLPQWYLEPILLGEAARLGVKLRFEHELVGFKQDGSLVRARVRDCSMRAEAGEEIEIRAQYMVAGDGGRSPVAAALKLPMEGEAGMGTAINVLFEADLSKYVAHRPGSLYSIFDHGYDELTGGYATLRMVRPWTQWLAMFPEVAMGDKEVSMDETLAQKIILGMIGDASVKVKVQGISRWLVNRVIAAKYSAGRVFCAGDAVHRHPPWNGLGSNTCIQDSFNLAWKIALVLRGHAGTDLLETYSDERQPIGRRVVERAIGSFAGGRTLLETLGMRAGQNALERRAVFARLLAPGSEGEALRRRWRAAIEERNYVYNTLGVELNQIYDSAAVVNDGTPRPAFDRDEDLHYHATTWPGARLPHCWLEHDARPLSTQDLCGQEHFTLLTGIGGVGWKEAAKQVSVATGVAIEVREIGLGLTIKDPYGDWARLSEVEDNGCLLVRPDLHVGWRCKTIPRDAQGRLAKVMRQLLGK